MSVRSHVLTPTREVPKVTESLLVEFQANFVLADIMTSLMHWVRDVYL